MVRWNTLGDDTPCAYSTAVPNCDARQNGDVPGNPTVITYCYYAAELRSACATAQVRVKRVGATVEGDVGPDESARPDGDGAGVEDGAVEVDKDIAPNLDIRAVVDLDGPLDPGVLVQEGVLLGVRITGRGKRLFALRDSRNLSVLDICRHSLLTTHSFQYCAICRRVNSPAVLSRSTAWPHRRRAATSCGEKAWYSSPRCMRARFSASSISVIMAGLTLNWLSMRMSDDEIMGFARRAGRDVGRSDKSIQL